MDMGGRRTNEWAAVAAARAAGLTEVPVILRARPPERDRLLMQLAENLDRADMSPIDEALAFQALAAHQMTQTQIAKAIHRSQTYVSFRMQLLAMPDTVRLALDVGWITIGDALAVPKGLWGDKAAVARLAKVIREGGPAVRNWARAEIRRLDQAGKKTTGGKYTQARAINVAIKVHEKASAAARKRGMTVREYVEDLIVTAGKKPR